MIYELLPIEIKILYLKMKTSCCLQGFFDALSELLDELEFNKETKESFEHIKQSLDHHENILNEQIQKSLLWINTKLKFLKKSQFQGSKKTKKYIEDQEDNIKKGTISIFQENSYLEMMFNLLESSSNMAAEYGSFDIIKDWTKNANIKQSSIFFELDDPFLNQELPDTIFPNADFGIHFEKRLRTGFIKVSVILPNELSSRPNYKVEVGSVDLNYPLEIEESREQMRGNIALEMKESRPSMLLRELYFYAFWRDMKDTDLIFPQNPSEIDLINFYNKSTSNGYFRLSLALKNTQKVCRENISKALDRFLLYMLQEIKQRNDPNRAFRYAYAKIKKFLLCMDENSRRFYTYNEIIKKIMEQAKLEVLSFQVFYENCNQACKYFAKVHGWKPKRKSAQKKMVAPTR